MTYEVEKKFIVNDLTETEEALRQMNVTIGPVKHLSDIYFSHPCRDFEDSDEAFRIRQVGESNYLTYKGPRIDGAASTRLENEVDLQDGSECAAQLIELMDMLGFKVLTTVKKHRRIASISRQNVVIDVSLDQVEHLGGFVELEVIAEQSNLELAQKMIDSVAGELALTRDERLSYCELMLKLQ